MALALLSSYEERRVEGDVITFNALIGACDKGQRWQLAVHVLQQMVQGRVERDRISFYTAPRFTPRVLDLAIYLIAKLAKNLIPDHLEGFR